MDLPDLVRGKLGEESVRTAVSLGETDLVCFTASRALVYSGEGILSDESVEAFPLSTSRLRVTDGRRKTTFELDFVEGPRTFSVPNDRAEAVLEALLEGILRERGVADAEESVVGVYRFSQLTLTITEKRVVKQIGAAAWGEDAEVFDFAQVTGLEFEEGSVATAMVLGVEGRLERIKAPNDDAPLVRRDLETALFDFHDVESVEELNAALGDDEDEEEGESDRDSPGGFDLESEIDPLVGERDDDVGTSEPETPLGGEPTDAEESPRPSSMTVDPTTRSDAETAADSDASAAAEAGTDADVDADTDGDTDTDEDTDTDVDTDSRTNAGTEAATESASGMDSEPVDDDPEPTGPTSRAGEGQSAGADPDDGTGSGTEAGDGRGTDAAPGTGRTGEAEPQTGALPSEDRLTGDDLAAVESELAELRTAVSKQNELLRKHHQALRKVLSALEDDG